jgi:signal peptidase I
MIPTLEVGQQVLVNRFIYDFSDPSVGDIVVFHPPAGSDDAENRQCGVTKPSTEACPRPTPAESDETFIKRIVAGPGDRLRIIHGHPIVNGRSVDGGWTIEPCAGCSLPRAITIPPDHYFVMGDNRPNSDDSRFWGPIPRGWIVGQAFFTYWPPDRVGPL